MAKRDESGQTAKVSPSEAPVVDRATAEDIVLALRGWYFTRRRLLPWRDDPTPYRVWVSEIMLQQTQVVTVLPYFERFIGAFPTVEALAAASEEAVMTQWAGLGYYRRARNLHLAAKRVADAGGVFPRSVAGLLELPGIGRYTAGAIASIAFGIKAPLLDGNVARVLSRVFSMTDPIDGTRGQKALWALAEALVPGDDPSSHNQALMELGALVCSPRSPACGECPLADRCRALATGRQTELPVKARRVAPQPVAAVSGLWRDGELALFAQRPEGLLGGLWELPSAELDGPVPGDELAAELGPAIEEAFAARVGVTVLARELIATVEHQFTHRSLTLKVVEVTGRTAAAVPESTDHYPRLAWRPLVDPGLPLSTLTRKVIKAVGRGTRKFAEGLAKPGYPRKEIREERDA